MRQAGLALLLALVVWICTADSVVPMHQHTKREKMARMLPFVLSRVGKFVPNPTTDLEIHLEQKPTQVRFGSALVGATLGSAIGASFGPASFAVSGGTPETQEMVGSMWAGALAGGFAGFRQINIDAPVATHLSAMERMERVREGLQNGIMAGVVAGAFAQIYSGSSDEGGSSTSSSSSSPSSKMTEDQPQPTSADERDLPRPMVASQQLPALHYAFAGAMAGMAVAYFEPEVTEQGIRIGEKSYVLRKRAEVYIEGYKKGQIPTDLPPPKKPQPLVEVETMLKHVAGKDKK